MSDAEYPRVARKLSEKEEKAKIEPEDIMTRTDIEKVVHERTNSLSHFGISSNDKRGPVK